MRRLHLLTLVLIAAPGLAQAQPIGGGLTPLALDLKKVPVGSWAEYTVTIGGGGGMTMKSRWALVARDANGSTLETSVEGGPVAMMGGKMVMKVALVADPLKSDKPIKQAVVQVGDRDPMEMPLNMPNMPPQKFQKPDPKKLVGKEQIKVAAGTFKTSHYHDVTERGVIDLWVSEGVGPLGMVKMTATPPAGKQDPQTPPISMELTGKGKDAKGIITKSPKPFDPAELGGAGAPPPGGPPPGAGAPGPGKAPPPGGPPPAKAPAPKP
jgi:hypothetical protein